MDERAAAQHSLVVGYKVKVQRMATSRVAEVCCISNAGGIQVFPSPAMEPSTTKDIPRVQTKKAVSQRRAYRS